MWIFRQCWIWSCFSWIRVSKDFSIYFVTSFIFLDFSQALLIWKTLENTTLTMVKELTLKDSFVLLLLIDLVQELLQWTPNYGLNLIHLIVEALMLNASKQPSYKNNMLTVSAQDGATIKFQKKSGLNLVLKAPWCIQTTIISSKWWSKFGMSVRMKRPLFTKNKQCRLLLLWDKD